MNIHHQIDHINHHQYLIPHSNAADIQQQNRIVSLHSANPDNLILIQRDSRLQHPELLHSDETCRNDSVNLTIVHNAMLNHHELNQNERILTVIDSQGSRIIHANNQNDGLMTRENHNVHSLQSMQVMILVTSCW